ncbi:hypothetical protein ACFX1T_034181 [Malus domestica]
MGSGSGRKGLPFGQLAETQEGEKVQGDRRVTWETKLPCSRTRGQSRRNKRARGKKQSKGEHGMVSMERGEHGGSCPCS